MRDSTSEQADEKNGKNADDDERLVAHFGSFFKTGGLQTEHGSNFPVTASSVISTLLVNGFGESVAGPGRTV
jgi:hypothetical protein